MADTVTSVFVLAKPSVPGDVTTAESLVYSASVFYPVYVNVLPSVLWPVCVILLVLCPSNARLCVLSAVCCGFP